MPDFHTSSFPKSWYPLCRSADLQRGQILLVQALGISLTVFRTQQGRVGALSAVCCHMGANLSRGRVVGEHVQCPLHEWEFDAAGACQRIPATDSPTERAHQLALQTKEQYGLVFAFWGGQPTFDLPRFQELDEIMFSHAFVTPFDAPYQVLVANAYDEQHFGPIHGREFLEPPQLTTDSPHHFRIHFKARVTGKRFSDRLTRILGMKNVEIAINCWGSNTLLIHNKGTLSNIFVSILPEDENHSRVFITTLTAKPRNPFRLPLRRAMLAVAHQLTLAFLSPDIQALGGMDFKPTVLISEADHAFIEWVKYWKSLPRESAHD